jgi:hypothetical protein
MPWTMQLFSQNRDLFAATEGLASVYATIPYYPNSWVIMHELTKIRIELTDRGFSSHYNNWATRQPLSRQPPELQHLLKWWQAGEN